uniref:Uncharacterized protein n=1 Tax=Roseihalotalea indica TaxID=2867963 RepID=A0AA49GM59_9BACT|nr:hypothetical protein K4G66_31235 [Tunicatimonas sp. TK19036]
MKNKALAFDYLHEAIYNNVNVVDDLPLQPDFTSEEKEELSSMLEVIRNLTRNSLDYQSIQQPEASELAKLNLRKQQIEVENSEKAAEALRSNLENTFQTMMGLKSSIQDVINDAKGAYKYVLWMYVVSFYLGIALILTSIFFAAQGKTILTIAFGSIGLVDIIGHFIFKPPLELQTSRSNLAQLMVVLTNWFADIMNLNSYLSMKGSQVTLKEVENISVKQNANTEHMLALIEKYCEPSNLKQEGKLAKEPAL